MATMVNNRQQCIAQNVSYTYCLKVTKFYCTSLSGLRAVKKSLATLCPPDLIELICILKGYILYFLGIGSLKSFFSTISQNRKYIINTFLTDKHAVI